MPLPVVYISTFNLRRFHYPHSPGKNQKLNFLQSIPFFDYHQHFRSPTSHLFPFETSFCYQLQKVFESLLWKQHPLSSVLLWKKKKKKVSTCSRDEHHIISNTLYSYFVLATIQYLTFQEIILTENSKFIVL